MASASIPGRKAYVRSSTTLASTATTSQVATAELTDYTLNVARAEINVTNHDSSGWHENISGVLTWSGSATMNYLSTGAGQGNLRAALLGTNPALVPISFMQTTSATAKKYVGKARLTGFDIKHPTEGEITGTISFVGSGALVRTA